MNIGLYLKIAKIAGPFLIGGLVAGFAAYKFQQVRIDNIKIELKQARNDLSACHEANASNQEAIRKLQEDVKKSNSLCTSRLKVKDSVIDRLRAIDSLKKPVNGKKTMSDMDKAKITQTGASGEAADIDKKGAMNEKDGNIVVGDPILRELNRMFRDTASR